MRDHPSPWVFSKFGKATRFKPKVPEKLGFQKMGGGGRRISTHPEGEEKEEEKEEEVDIGERKDTKSIKR